MSQRKKPILASTGADVSISKNTNQTYSCPDKFLRAFVRQDIKAKEYADKEELIYFEKFKENNSTKPNYGWEDLSLQEKKVINGLEEFKIPAYIGYRLSFKDGLKRIGYEKKPVFALLEVASACNIKCPFCFQSDPTFTTKEFMGVIDTSLAFNIIDQIDDNKIRGITIASRGEPLIHKDICLIIDYISSKKNILEIKLNTNAKRLNEAILEKLLASRLNILVISTDHYEKEKYEEYRHGAKFENFISNISKINSLRKKFGRIDTLYTRSSGVAVDPNMKKEKFDAFYNQFFDESATVEILDRWNTYENSKNIDEFGPCGLPFERLYIWYDGTTNPCDADYKSYLSPGNIGEINLKECWSNLSYLRKRMLEGNRRIVNPCDRCGSQ